MPTRVHLESDDGIAIELAEVDAPLVDVADIVARLAAEGPAIVATPCGAQVGVGPVQPRTDFADEEIEALHEVVTYAVDELDPAHPNDLDQAAYGVCVLEAVTFTKLTLADGQNDVAFALQPPDHVYEFATAFATGGHQGVIIAAIPDADGEAVYGPGDTAPLHQTIGYFGKIADLQDGEREALMATAERLAAEFPPFTAKVSGKGVLGPDRVDVVITEARSLQAMHDSMLADETVAAMYAERNGHPTWVSHVTGLDADVGDEVPFRSVAVWIGDEIREEFPLGGGAEFHLQGQHDQKSHGNRQGRISRFIFGEGNGPLIKPELPKSNPDLTSPEQLAEDRVLRSRLANAVLPNRDDRNTRAGALFGKGQSLDMDENLDVVLPNGALSASVPFKSAKRLKREPLYDKELVAETLRRDRVLRRVDPRVLRATQPKITREGLRYYLGPGYNNTGLTYADQTNRGNVHPVVYRSPYGEWVLLSGHHRATAALLQGRQLDAVVIEPDIGPPPARARQFRTAVAPTSKVADVYRDVTPSLAIDDESPDPSTPERAADIIRNGHLALVGSDDDAVQTLVELGASLKHAVWLVRETATDAGPDVDLDAAEFHLQGQHDQKSHGNRGGASFTPNDLGLAIPLPTLDELAAYDPVPETEANENLLLRHLDENGQLTADRRAVHDTLVLNTLTRDGELYPSHPEGERRAVMLGGGAAAGKSTALKMGYVEGVEDGPTINPDDFKIQLPEAAGPSKTGKQGNGLADEHPVAWAGITHDESSYLGKRAIEGAAESGMNMVIDKTQSNGGKAVRQIEDLQSRGYSVSMAYVTTDIDRAVSEAMRRGEDKGRFVGEPVVRKGHVGANQSFVQVARETSGVDMKLITTYPKNDDGSYSTPVLTASATSGGGITVHSRPDWDAFVARLPDPEILTGIDLTFA